MKVVVARTGVTDVPEVLKLAYGQVIVVVSVTVVVTPPKVFQPGVKPADEGAGTVTVDVRVTVVSGIVYVPVSVHWV